MLKRCLVLLLTLGSPAYFTARADVPLADFEHALPAKLNDSTQLALKEGDAPQGRRYLSLMGGGDLTAPAGVKIPLPVELAVSRQDGLSGQIRVAGDGVVTLRLLAMNESGQVVYQRRMGVRPSQEWARFNEPFSRWRWGQRHGRGWDEVKTIVLQAESPASEIAVDDVRLTGNGSPDAALPDLKWLARMAFADRAHQQVRVGGIEIATDAAEITPADLRLLADRGVKVRDLVRGFFKLAEPPRDDRAIASLLIFKAREDMNTFYTRLGEFWRAQIAAPQSDGYTVQNISTSTYSKEHGIERPVYIHELTHGIVAYELSLMSGYPPHNWLQEGLASYVQLCLHPTSIAADFYPQAFAAGVGGAESKFQQLKDLIGKPVKTSQYAQLASLVAFLMELHPEVLRELANSLGMGEQAVPVLTRLNLPVDELEKQWLAWGRARFTGKAEIPLPPFEVPPELATFKPASQ